MDRGLFDAMVWFDFLSLRGAVTAEDCQAVHGFLSIEKWRGLVHGVFLFTCDPDTALRRERSEKLTDEPGTAMNPTFLARLNEAYQKARPRLKEFRYSREIDTSDGKKTTPKSTAAEVAAEIVRILGGLDSA